ncbi:uncharacterized protein B0I36DRAFT_403910, partial [Microdochium trichocladiopsis]
YQSSLTKTWHSESYPAISPSRPALSAEDKVVVITGSASGIGFSIARAFAAAGCTKMAILARKENILTRAKESIEQEYPGTNGLALPTDITDGKQLTIAFTTVAESFRAIDILVCSAAYMPASAPVLSPECDLDSWWNTFTTNVLGVMKVARAFEPHAAEGGQILNIATALATLPPLQHGLSSYAASKAAAAKAFDCIALENPHLKGRSTSDLVL